MSAEQYMAMTFVQLKQECQKRGLDTGGAKDHLVKRLLSAGGGAPASPGPSSPSPAVTSPSSHSPASSSNFPKPAAKLGSPSPATQSPTPKAGVSWKDEPKSSPVTSPVAAAAPPVSAQSKFLQDAEKRRREAEAELERQRNEDSLSRFAQERAEKQKQEEAERRRRDEQARQQEEEQRQRDEANRRKQQEEEQRRQSESRRQQEEAERSRKASEEAENRRRQEEERRRQQDREEQERRTLQEEQEKKRLRDEEQRFAELREKQQADLKRVGDEKVRAAMAESQRLEAETLRVHEEAKRKAERAKSVQEEARRKEEEARKLTEESRKLTEEAKQCYEQYRKLEEQAKAARRAIAEAQKKGEDDARKAAEASIIAARKAQEDSTRKAAEERDRKAAEERQAAEAKRREEERKQQQQQQQQQEENRRREEAERKREEEEERRQRDEERKKAMESPPAAEKKRTIEVFDSDSDEEDNSSNKGGSKTNGKTGKLIQDPALAALVEQRSRQRMQAKAAGSSGSSAPSSPVVSRPITGGSNPSTPSAEEQRRKLMATKPLPAAPKSAPTTPQEHKQEIPKMSVEVAVMGGSDSDEGSNGPESSRDRGTTPRGLIPFAKVAWYLRDWEWNSSEELGQSEDEPALVQTLRREYRGDMFWLICESIDDARKLTRRVPEAQKMLEPSSGFYDPNLDRASPTYSSLLMIQQGKKVFFLCSRDLTLCIRKSCTYIEDSMRDPRYRGHGVALRNKMIDRLEELQDFYPREDQDAMADAVDFDDDAPRSGSGIGGAPPSLQRGHTRNKSLGEKLALTTEDKEAIKGMKDQAGKALTTGMEKTKSGLKNIVSSLK